MLLSCRFLNDVQGVNSFEPVAQVEFAIGDAQTLYFQLVDRSLDRSDQGYVPAGRRYVPPTGTIVQVTLANIDDAKAIVRSAVQPFPQDASVWSVPILSSDPLVGTVSLLITLTEPTRIINARLGVGNVVRFR